MAAPGYNPFSGGGSTAAYTPFAAAGGAPTVHHNILGNLLSDIKSTALGLPAGLVNMAEHPISSVEQMGKSTWHDWAPLVHGDFAKFGHQFAAHPLAPILDVASLLTAGAGAAGMGARLATAGEAAKTFEAGGSVADMGKLARFGRPQELNYAKNVAADAASQTPAPAMVRQLSRNPLVRMRQLGFHNVSNQLEQHLPDWYGTRVGSQAKYGRMFNKEISRRDTALRNQTNQIHSDIAKQNVALTPAQAVAVHAQLGQMTEAGRMLSNEKRASSGLIMQNVYDQIHHHAMVIPHPGPNGLAPDGFAFVKRNNGNLAKNRVGVPIEQQLKEAPALFTTKNVSEAAVGAGGHGVRVVPRRTFDMYAKEGADSASFLKKMYTQPSRIWKMAQVGWSPRMVADTSVGNLAMYLMAQGGHHAIHGLLDAQRMGHGDAVAFQDLVKGVKAADGKAILDKHFGDIIHSTNASSLIGPNSEGGAAGRLGKGLYGVVHRNEQYLKRAQISAGLRGSEEVKAMAAKHGLNMGDTKQFWQASNKALTAHPALVRRLAHDARTTIGDYQSFNGTEKAIRNIVPFYSWDRHIARHTLNMLSEHPGRVAVGSQVGQQGAAITNQKLGNIPSFMQGLLPLSMLGIKDHGGRVGAIDTGGLNPYSSVPSLIDAGAALVGGGGVKAGDALGGQVNPIISGLVGAVTGKNLSSGAPVAQHGGVIPTVATNMVDGIPESKILRTMIFGPPQPKPNARTGTVKPFLYDKSMTETASHFAGLPIKHVSLAAASALADKEKGIKKPKS